MSSFAEHLPADQLDALRQIGGDEIDLGGLTIDELRAEIQARYDLTYSLQTDLDADKADGYRMGHIRRQSIGWEIAETVRECKALRARLHEKEKTIVTVDAPVIDRRPKGPSAAQLEVERLQQEAKARKEELRQQRLAAHDRRDQDRTQLFTRAAVNLMGREQGDLIWARAREMFPEAACWADFDWERKTKTGDEGGSP